MAKKAEKIDSAPGDEGTISRRLARVYAESLMNAADKAGKTEKLEGEFIPRPLFGLYLKSFAEHIKRMSARNGVGLKIVQDEVQDISYAWAKQAVDTVMHVCLALDELVAARMTQLKSDMPAQLVST